MAYPRAYRNLAYELWREDRNQECKGIAERLNATLDVEIPLDTVQDWRNRDGWENRWASEVRGLNPQLLERIAGGVAVGTLGAVEYLSQVVEQGISGDIVDIKAAQARIQAARILIGAEISLITAAQVKQPKKKDRNISISGRESNEDLLALEQQARSSLSSPSS